MRPDYVRPFFGGLGSGPGLTGLIVRGSDVGAPRGAHVGPLNHLGALHVAQYHKP